jgi:hypothetical protein
MTWWYDDLYAAVLVTLCIADGGSGDPFVPVTGVALSTSSCCRRSRVVAALCDVERARMYCVAHSVADGVCRVEQR